MDELKKWVAKAIASFFSNFFDQVIKYFSNSMADLMKGAGNILNMPLVQSGIKYSQELAIVLLVLKTMREAYETYILYQSGDSDADPSGLLIRTGQAVAVICTLPWIVNQLFTFGDKIAHDIANLSTGTGSIADCIPIMTAALATGIAGGFEIVLPILFLIIVVFFLIIAIQASIRGAELALMSFIGPIMALNITNNNRSVWSSWFKEVAIICCSQGIQVFMIMGALSLFTNQSMNGVGILSIFGWLWVTFKAPKYVKQLAYSTGFTGAVGGTAKQAGIMYLTNRFLRG